MKICEYSGLTEAKNAGNQHDIITWGFKKKIKEAGLDGTLSRRLVPLARNMSELVTLFSQVQLTPMTDDI